MGEDAADELPVFPSDSKSAGTLDLANINDEPTQLIRMLVIAVKEHIGFSEHDAEWKALLGYFHSAELELKRMNEAPSQKHGKVGTL